MRFRCLPPRADTAVVYAAESSLEAFRARARTALEARPPRGVGLNLARRELGEEGDGHMSPLAAYDEDTDRLVPLVSRDGAPHRRDSGAPPACPTFPEGPRRAHAHRSAAHKPTRRLGRRRAACLGVAALHTRSFPPPGFLLLDVARYKYPGAWVRAAQLFAAMNSTDTTAGRHAVDRAITQSRE